MNRNPLISVIPIAYTKLLGNDFLINCCDANVLYTPFLTPILFGLLKKIKLWWGKKKEYVNIFTLSCDVHHHPLSMSMWGLGLFFKVVIVQVVHTNNYGILDVLQIVVPKTQH